MQPTILDNFIKKVHEKNLGVYGIVIKQDGKEPIEYRFRKDDKVNVYSISKTFTSLAIGICIDEKRFDITDKLIDFFPEYKSYALECSLDITIKDMLQMASGKNCRVFGDEPNELDQVARFLSSPSPFKRGIDFNYCTSNTYMLSRIIKKITGESLRDYSVPRLFTPLGIHNPQWFSCPNGHTLAGTGLFLTTSEMSKLCDVLLHKGLYNGAKIVSESYLHDAIYDVVDNSNHTNLWQEDKYGYQIWHYAANNSFGGIGMYGQYCIVLPDLQASISVTAHYEKDQKDVCRAIFSEVVPNL